MKSIAGVLPSNPQFEEQVLAKPQPEYLPLNVVQIKYNDGTISMISCYKLSFKERVKMLFNGKLWLEQLTFGQLLQPQRATVNEPLTDADYSKPKLTAKERFDNIGKQFKQAYRKA
jgi:hypothetical protein